MQNTDISISPYFDDYSEDKNFHRVLFRPRPVQARELNAIQSYAIEQNERVGRHLFKDGSVVIPGGITTRNNQTGVKISLGVGFNINDLLNRTDTLYIKSLTTNLTARIKKVIPPDGVDQTVLFIDYVDSGTSGTNTKFTIGETCSIYASDNGVNTDLMTVSIDENTVGVWVKILAGVYFVRGFYVKTVEQDVVVSKYTTNPTKIVGFKIVEEIVTEVQDDTLYSNATGTPNYKAPGAARLKITLTLVVKDTADPADKDFIEIVKYTDGILQHKFENTQYNLIEKTLAQRTYEESGDYTVNQFPIEIKEHILDNTHPDGKYIPVSNGGIGDESKYVIDIKPGLAYVRGYRVENIGLETLETNKARTTQFINNAALSSQYGGYILVRNLLSLPDIDMSKRVNLLLNDGTTVIGTFLIKSIKRITYSASGNGTTAQIFIADVRMNVGRSFDESRKIKYSDASNLMTAEITDTTYATVVAPTVYDSTNNFLVFRLPYPAIKTLKDNGFSDTTYTVMRSFNVTTDGSGLATVGGLTTSELFATINSNEYQIALTGAANAGTQYDVSTPGVLTLSGSPVGRTLSINLGAPGANKNIKVIAPVIKSAPVERTKTLFTNTETLTFSIGEATKTLNKTDILRINSITDTAIGANPSDVKALFSLNNGQEPNFYTLGTLSRVDTSKEITVQISYDYFQHSTGDYFTIDSYVDLGVKYDRKDIPQFKFGNLVYNLADCIDFRPSIDANGFAQAPSVSGEWVRPNDSIRFDLHYYLPRYDSLFVDSRGNFNIINGVPSDIPSIPSIPEDSMRLFNLYVPAYTEDVKDIKIFEVDNRRYTMRDIGALDKRIGTLEYYTSLNLLEAKTNKIQVFNESGLNRFKNGFMADDFNNLELCDLNDQKWSASIIEDRSLLTAQPIRNILDLSFKTTGSSNYKLNENIFSLDYAEKKEISQPFASRWINVNPYAVFTWNGTVELNPIKDFWHDDVYQPPIVINNTIDLTNGVRESIEQTVHNSVRTEVTIAQLGHIRGGATGTYAIDRHTTLAEQILTTRTTSIQSTLSTSVQNNLLVANIVIPYMRSIEINFKLSGFKPYSRLYPFFDDVDVSSVCAQTGKNKGDPIITDASGYLTGKFYVPNTSTFRFRTGVSTFRFSDSSTNSKSENDYTTAGEATFTSGGSMDIRQLTIRNTITKRAVTTTTNTTLSSRVLRVENRQWDPIAQSFMINQPGGAFLSSINIYFKTKAVSIPLIVQIRTMENGLPTHDILPFGQVTVLPSQITTSNDGSIATNIKFNDLVYLEEGVEYAVVLIANTQEYNVYISQLGEIAFGTTHAIAKQPYLGVFFASSNGSTWTPNQIQDMKFDLYIADFATNNPGVLIFKNNDTMVKPLGLHPLTSTNGSPVVTVKFKSHGFKVGDPVVLDGFIDGNGFVAADLNKTFNVASVVSIDEFTINVGLNSNLSGAFGGFNGTIKSNYTFVDFITNFETMVLNNTNIKWEYSYRRQNDRVVSPYAEFNINDIIYLINEGVVTTVDDFSIKATLTSSLKNLSPLIDLSGMGVEVINNYVNNDDANPVAAYVSKNVSFDNPSTESRFYVSAYLPGQSSIKLYYKLISSTSDQNLSSLAWTEITPVKPIGNDDQSVNEYEYRLKPSVSYVGFKIMIVMLADSPVDAPELHDVRAISLA